MLGFREIISDKDMDSSTKSNVLETQETTEILYPWVCNFLSFSFDAFMDVGIENCRVNKYFRMFTRFLLSLSSVYFVV